MRYFLHTSYELLFIARVTSFFLDARYELLLISQVRSYYGLLFIVQNTRIFASYEMDQ